MQEKVKARLLEPAPVARGSQEVWFKQPSLPLLLQVCRLPCKIMTFVMSNAFQIRFSRMHACLFMNSEQILIISWILSSADLHSSGSRSHCASSFSNSNYWGISTCTALLHIYLYPRWWRVLQQDRGFSSFGDFHSKYIFSMPVSQLLSRTWLGWPKIQKNSSKYPW